MKDLGLESPPLNCWAAGIMLGLVQILAMGLFKPLGVSQQFVEADAEVVEKVLQTETLERSSRLDLLDDSRPTAEVLSDEPRTLVSRLSRTSTVQRDSRPTSGRPELASATSGSSFSASRSDASQAVRSDSPGVDSAVGTTADGLLGRSVAQWRQATADEPGRDGTYDRWFIIGIPVGAALATIQLRRRRLRITTSWSQANSRSGAAGRAVAAFCGGFLALFGAAIARGALTGQFVSGWTQLSVSALPFTIGMICCGLLVAYVTYPQSPGADRGEF